MAFTTVAAAAALTSGCFDPHPQPGLICDDGHCPSGMQCTADRCEPPGTAACYGTAPVQICLTGGPLAPLTFTANTTKAQFIHYINTDPPSPSSTSSSECYAGVQNGAYCVIAARTMFAPQMKVRGFGSKPLVLLASDTITIGTDESDMKAGIDVSSASTDDPGAGSFSPTECPGTAPGSRAGGAGGSFVGKGGAGGDGGGGGNGGKPASPRSITALQGGCSGQNGNGAGGGTGGRGGGAVYLIAGNSITILGSGITAVGEGGGGATNPGSMAGGSGGGGGGAGGMIVLEAPTVTSHAPLLASGAGGGGASCLNSAGMTGADPLTADAAMGGSGGDPIGGAGGAGSTGASADSPGSNGLVGGQTSPASLDGGGGGGGGGAGYIGVRVRPDQLTLDPDVSPTATVMPLVE